MPILTKRKKIKKTKTNFEGVRQNLILHMNQTLEPKQNAGGKSQHLRANLHRPSSTTSV